MIVPPNSGQPLDEGFGFEISQTPNIKRGSLSPGIPEAFTADVMRELQTRVIRSCVSVRNLEAARQVLMTGPTSIQTFLQGKLSSMPDEKKKQRIERDIQGVLARSRVSLETVDWIRSLVSECYQEEQKGLAFTLWQLVCVLDPKDPDKEKIAALFTSGYTGNIEEAKETLDAWGLSEWKTVAGIDEDDEEGLTTEAEESSVSDGSEDRSVGSPLLIEPSAQSELLLFGSKLLENATIAVPEEQKGQLLDELTEVGSALEEGLVLVKDPLERQNLQDGFFGLLRGEDHPEVIVWMQSQIVNTPSFLHFLDLLSTWQESRLENIMASKLGFWGENAFKERLFEVAEVMDVLQDPKTLVERKKELLDKLQVMGNEVGATLQSELGQIKSKEERVKIQKALGALLEGEKNFEALKWIESVAERNPEHSIAIYQFLASIELENLDYEAGRWKQDSSEDFLYQDRIYDALTGKGERLGEVESLMKSILHRRGDLSSLYTVNSINELRKLSQVLEQKLQTAEEISYKKVVDLLAKLERGERITGQEVSSCLDSLGQDREALSSVLTLLGFEASK